ncbi:hypothetical protein PG991_012142 [Apiospora marii]|uniref:Uncharacterized protein n=1 Tax=Apiospora marii TaxID=335849 RepID=A0ABR1R9U5_9PEZI
MSSLVNIFTKGSPTFLPITVKKGWHGDNVPNGTGNLLVEASGEVATPYGAMHLIEREDGEDSEAILVDELLESLAHPSDKLPLFMLAPIPPPRGDGQGGSTDNEDWIEQGQR